MHLTRRSFLKSSSLGLGATAFTHLDTIAAPQQVVDVEKGERPFQSPEVEVLHPKARIPLSFIIDDSTCLVNLAHFGIPQFQEVFPDRYRQPWRLLPREIPDRFVLEFGSWCRDNGIKGKYSIVPYPACVGWIDRFIPGWTSAELRDSLKLVRDVMTQDWDIHPEMISHTRVIDIRTGRPFPDATPGYMENWEWSQDKSADELASYIEYALEVLKRADLPCEGMTTPGGFGDRNQNNLAIGTLEAVRQVYGAEIPHYFRNLYTETGSDVTPKVYHASGISGSDPRCVVSIIGCTGDWFGGWDGLVPGSVDRFITEDLKNGRLVEVLESGQPAVLVCHWPGIYYNGQKVGFRIFQEVVKRVKERFPQSHWLKNSELARYSAAKELTELRFQPGEISIQAAFAAPDFTLRVNHSGAGKVDVIHRDVNLPLNRLENKDQLDTNTWVGNEKSAILCFDLPRGQSKIQIA